MGYKPSRYNFFFQAEDGTHLAFNAMSGGFARIEERNYEEIQRILTNPNNYKPVTDGEKKLWDFLIRGRFLVEEQLDEFKLLKLRYQAAKLNTNSLGLVIMVTAHCNFSCPYCYEIHEDRTIKTEVMEALLNLVRKRTPHLNKFYAVWFGGEPLLRLDLIRELSSHFIKECLKNKCEYEAVIVSNGYLLSEKNIKELKEMKVRRAQVTLDGPPSIHNKRRRLKKGGETFNVIVNNLLRAAEEMSITIKVNIDIKNEDAFPELLDYLEAKGLKRSNVQIAPGPTGVYDDTAFYYKPYCMDVEEFRTAEIWLYKQLMGRGFIPRTLPLTISVFCTANLFREFLIDTDGYLYKCYPDIGKRDSAVGRLTLDGSMKMNYARWIKWLGYDPFDDEECMHCRYLPVCMGGCPLLRATKGQEKKCKFRKNLEEILKIYYSNVLKYPYIASYANIERWKEMGRI